MGKPDPRYRGSWQLNLAGNDVKRISDPLLKLQYEYDKLSDKAISGCATHADRERLQKVYALLRAESND